jgi:hypothetical protein
MVCVTVYCTGCAIMACVTVFCTGCTTMVCVLLCFVLVVPPWSMCYSVLYWSLCYSALRYPAALAAQHYFGWRLFQGFILLQTLRKQSTQNMLLQVGAE